MAYVVFAEELEDVADIRSHITLTKSKKLYIAAGVGVLTLILASIVAKHMIDATNKFDLDCTEARGLNSEEALPTNTFGSIWLP